MIKKLILIILIIMLYHIKIKFLYMGDIKKMINHKDNIILIYFYTIFNKLSGKKLQQKTKFKLELISVLLSLMIYT